MQSMSRDDENVDEPRRGHQTTVMVIDPLLPSFWWHALIKLTHFFCMIWFVKYIFFEHPGQ